MESLPTDIKELSAALLEAMPQKDPFRFCDEIIELNDEKIVSRYHYRAEEWYYKGHFPGRPVTPGVIQIETMAQTAVVAYGIWLVFKEYEEKGGPHPSEFLTVFTDVEAEFFREIPPETTVTITGEKIFWRRKKLRCQASIILPDGKMAATAKLSGLGVKA